MSDTPADRGFAAVMALPDTVRIGPYDYAVKKMTMSEAEVLGLFGQHSSLEQTISIRERMPTAIKAVDTFLHEVLHAIYWAYGIHDKDNEERTVSAQSTGLTALLRDNPWLLPWITDCLHPEPDDAAALSAWRAGVERHRLNPER